jgi:hypothetical protein
MEASASLTRAWCGGLSHPSKCPWFALNSTERGPAKASLIAAETVPDARSATLVLCVSLSSRYPYLTTVHIISGMSAITIQKKQFTA